MPEPLQPAPLTARYRKLWGTVATLVVGWVTLKLGLDLDPDVAALISGTLAAIALERLPNAPKLDQQHR